MDADGEASPPKAASPPATTAQTTPSPQPNDLRLQISVLNTGYRFLVLVAPTALLSDLRDLVEAEFAGLYNMKLKVLHLQDPRRNDLPFRLQVGKVLCDQDLVIAVPYRDAPEGYRPPAGAAAPGSMGAFSPPLHMMPAPGFGPLAPVPPVRRPGGCFVPSFVPSAHPSLAQPPPHSSGGHGEGIRSSAAGPRSVLALRRVTGGEPQEPREPTAPTAPTSDPAHGHSRRETSPTGEKMGDPDAGKKRKSSALGQRPFTPAKPLPRRINNRVISIQGPPGSGEVKTSPLVGEEVTVTEGRRYCMPYCTPLAPFGQSREPCDACGEFRPYPCTEGSGCGKWCVTAGVKKTKAPGFMFCSICLARHRAGKYLRREPHQCNACHRPWLILNEEGICRTCHKYLAGSGPSTRRPFSPRITHERALFGALEAGPTTDHPQELAIDSKKAAEKQSEDEPDTEDDDDLRID